MDQTEEPPLNTHQQHPEEVEHHENGATKMFRKVKARAKKFKNSLTKHGQSNEHEQDHDLVEEDDDDDELEPEVIDAPGVTGKPRETNVPASEEIIPPGTKVFPVVSSDYTKPTESVPVQEASYGHDAPAHSVRTTFTSDKEEKRDVPIHHPLSELSDREESRETHHESLNTPVSLLSGTEDVTSTFAPSGDDEYLDGQRKVNVETPITLEEESAVSDYLSGVSNYQSKVTDPTKEETGGVPEIAESFGNMEVTDESPDQKPGQFERDLSTRSKEFKEFDQDFDSVLGKDSPAKFPGESGVVFPVGFGDESGAELEKDFPTRSHDFDMKTETGMDTNSPSRSHEFDLKTESGNDKNSPMGFGSESGAELEKEFDQKNDSGRNEYSPESDGGLGAPLGGNFPVRSHELDLKNESDIDKDVPTGFDGEPDFLAKGRPGYGEASEEDKFPARSDDVEVETELGRDPKTETLDQFSPELSHPKERDEFKESRDDFEETRDEKTEEPKQSTYTEKFASMLGYSGEIPVGDQTQVAGTVDEKLTPVNEKDQETESAVTTKLPISGGGSGVEEQRGEDKSVSGRDYVAEKLTTEEEDKAFSDMVAEKLQIGGEEEKKETTTKEVEKISTEKAASEEGEAVEEEVKGRSEMTMMSLPKMRLSCLQPHLHFTSSRSIAAALAFPSSSIRNRTSCLVRCGSARRRLTTKSSRNSKLERAQPPPLGLERHWRYAVVGGVSVGLMMVLVLGMDAEKAMALGPEGPLMEEFWDNVRRYGLYALTVSTGALSAVFEPIFELLKNPISAILILLILGGSFYIVSQVVSAMIGVNEFAYQYSY